MAHIYLLSRVNVILDTLWIQKCVSVLQGFLYEVGGWVTGVTGRDFGPRWVEKPCWTFTQSIWRGRLKRAARRPCCSSVEKNIVVILVRDNFQQICPVWFRQHTRGEPAMSRGVCSGLLESLFLSYNSLLVHEKNDTRVRKSFICSYYFMCSLLE